MHNVTQHNDTKYNALSITALSKKKLSIITQRVKTKYNKLNITLKFSLMYKINSMLSVAARPPY
jgi:hypothetical protein